MMTNIRDAEEILSRRRIEKVSDLNLGDLSIFLEVIFLLKFSGIFGSVKVPPTVSSSCVFKIQNSL